VKRVMEREEETEKKAKEALRQIKEKEIL